MREHKIKTYTFPAFVTPGSLHSTEHINGEIIKIPGPYYTYGGPAKTGVLISGTNEIVMEFNSSSAIVFPLVYGTDSSANSGSPHIAFKRIVNSKLWIYGSPSIGNPICSGTTIYYR